MRAARFRSWHIASFRCAAELVANKPSAEIGRTIPRAVRRSVTVYISPQDAQLNHMLEGIRLYSGLLSVIFICLSGELTHSFEQNREQQ
jgi:hypothetical protein